jgi:hydroxylamine reductase
VLDAGQCNDSYSLAVIAMKLQEILGAEDINDLPIDFDVAWYEQKAVCVLLALLALGFKGVRIGPTLPAFLSQRVAEKIISAFDLKGITDVESDVAAIAGS